MTTTAGGLDVAPLDELVGLFLEGDAETSTAAAVVIAGRVVAGLLSLVNDEEIPA